MHCYYPQVTYLPLVGECASARGPLKFQIEEAIMAVKLGQRSHTIKCKIAFHLLRGGGCLTH